MLIHSSSQLLTLSGGPQRGQQLGQLGIIENGAVLVRGNNIVEVGESSGLLAAYPDEERFDAQGKTIMPGLVDPHTHLIFMGNRAFEFEMRLQGKSYMEIMAAGGGIVNTVKATRAATVEELKSTARLRMQGMLQHGTTTAEAKTGYGLDSDSELRQMQAILELDSEGPMELVPTYLGAHAIPVEYKNDPQAYTDLVVKRMLPELDRWWQENAASRPRPFVDVFCETGAFSLEQSSQILKKAKTLGFPLKIHADEFDNLGGASLAASLGAVSADHLVKTSEADIRSLSTVRTPLLLRLPPTPFGSGRKRIYASRENPGGQWNPGNCVRP